MVVLRRSSLGGDLSSLALSRPNVLVRRFQPSLRVLQSQTSSLPEFGWRARSLDQPPRVVGRRERPQGSLYLLGRSSCCSLLRQHYRGGVSEKARRDFVSDPRRGNPSYSALGGAVEYHPDA